MTVPPSATGGQVLERVPAADRGALRIADRVVAKVAGQAAREALDTTAQQGRPHTGRAPHASVAVRAGSARIRLAVELAYPCDVAAVCAALRGEVVERVRVLTGMAVPEVTVQVERLHPRAGLDELQGRAQ